MIVSGLVALLALAPAAALGPSGVVLNELNCTGTDWVEVMNTGNAEVSLAGWLLTDDPIDQVPPRDSHRMRFGDQAVLAAGAHLVVTKGNDGFPFGLSCEDDTLRLANATDTLVDEFTLPSVPAKDGMTLGRIPDGTGTWSVTLPTPGTANVPEPSAVVLNEINCTGTDWVEVTNRSDTEVSLAGWLLTDDPIDQVPPRDSHRMRFGDQAVLAAGAHLVVTKGNDGFPFGLSCEDDTLRLANATDTLVDEFTLPSVPAKDGMTLGRIPDGTGTWSVTLPTPGSPNVTAPDGQDDDPAWLYDPLQVTEIDLEASSAALSQLAAVPDEYVEARITLRRGASTYGPYVVGLRLKGQIHGSFRTLEGKAAFKVKFGYSVAGQRFFGLKGLTLNNMVQDPSMIAEANASLLVAATGAPTARVGYAYVTLNGSEYGLYANVEKLDDVWAQGWFTGTQHIYEANYTNDVVPGREGEFEVDEGSSTDRSDLEALSQAGAGDTEGWWERMQPVADLVEMTRVWAAEHYMWHWDGYSVAAEPHLPNNYYLHSDPTGRFSLITTGTDQTWLSQTWLDSSGFGVYGNGVLFRSCVADTTCRQLYIDALREIAASPEIAALPAKARAIRAAIAPWRARDPRREATIAVGEAQADAKIATMDARPAELAAWLAKPYFVAAVLDTRGSNDPPAGTVPPTSSRPVEVVAPQAPLTPPPTQLQAARPLLGKPVGVPAKPVAGKRFTLTVPVTRSDTGTPLLTGKLVCDPSVAGKVIKHTESFKAGKARLSFLVPTTANGKLLRIKIKVTASGRTAGRTYTYAVKTQALRLVFGKPVGVPAKPVAGKRFTLTVPVTRSDTGAPLLTGKLVCDPSVADKVIKHTESFKAGKARLSFLVPTTANGKLLRIKIKVTAAGRTASRTSAYAVR